MDKPIKSRHDLTRCTACRAHIRAAERPSGTVCPFCGANLRTARPLISLPTGRGTLLAASLLALSASGCGGAETQANSTIEPAPSEPADTPDPATATTDPDQPTSAGTDPSAGADQAPADQYADEPADDNPPVAEYGARPDVYEEQPAENPPAMPRYGAAAFPRSNGGQ